MIMAVRNKLVQFHKNLKTEEIMSRLYQEQQQQQDQNQDFDVMMNDNGGGHLQNDEEDMLTDLQDIGDDGEFFEELQ
jgi:hypothetical protein